MAEMDFLALAQRTHRELGLAGSGPSAVTGQSGRNQDVINWVLAAHEEIQTSVHDWNFDWAQGSFALSSGDDTYDPETDWAVTGGIRAFVRKGAYAYPTANGVNSRLFLQYLEWDQFRYLTVPVVPGQAVSFTLRPDGDVQFYPRPNVAMTAVMEYWRNPQVLAAADDVPRMPAWSHMGIVWKAAMIGCGRIKDWTRFDSAEEEYEKISHRMHRECRPQMMMGGPLA